MGNWFSSKSEDTSGAASTNNVVVKNNDSKISTEILLLIICVLKIIEFAYFVYINHVRRIKKRYEARANPA